MEIKKNMLKTDIWFFKQWIVSYSKEQHMYLNIFFFNYSAMLSDVPHDSETEFGADPYEIEDDLEEEPDFVPIDMSAKGGNSLLFYQIET